MLKSPLIQGLLKRGYEVLLLDDNIDEYCLSHLNEYEKKKLVNVAKSGFKFPGDEDEKEKLKKLKKMYQPLTSWMQDKFKDMIEKCEVSLRLVEDPMLIAASEHGFSGSMEKIARAQAQAKKDRANNYYSMKKILEINPYHPFIRELLERVKTSVDADTEESAKLMVDVALLNSGYLLENTSHFAGRFYKILAESLGMPRDVRAEEFEVDEEEKTTEESPIVTGDDVIPQEDGEKQNFDPEQDL